MMTTKTQVACSMNVPLVILGRSDFCLPPGSSGSHGHILPHLVFVFMIIYVFMMLIKNFVESTMCCRRIRQSIRAIDKYNDNNNNAVILLAG